MYDLCTQFLRALNKFQNHFLIMSFFEYIILYQRENKNILIVSNIDDTILNI